MKIKKNALLLMFLGLGFVWGAGLMSYTTPKQKEYKPIPIINIIGNDVSKDTILNEGRYFRLGQQITITINK